MIGWVCMLMYCSAAGLCTYLAACVALFGCLVFMVRFALVMYYDLAVTVFCWLCLWCLAYVWRLLVDLRCWLVVDYASCFAFTFVVISVVFLVVCRLCVSLGLLVCWVLFDLLVGRLTIVFVDIWFCFLLDCGLCCDFCFLFDFVVACCAML